MKVRSANLSFPPSTSPDVTGYKLYCRPSADGPIDEVDVNGDYVAQEFDIGTQLTVDLSTLPGFPTTDTTYNLGVIAVDDVGNESSMSIINDVPLDFTAPNAPGPVTVSYV